MRPHRRTACDGRLVSAHDNDQLLTKRGLVASRRRRSYHLELSPSTLALLAAVLQKKRLQHLNLDPPPPPCSQLRLCPPGGKIQLQRSQLHTGLGCQLSQPGKAAWQGVRLRADTADDQSLSFCTSSGRRAAGPRSPGSHRSGLRPWHVAASSGVALAPSDSGAAGSERRITAARQPAARPHARATGMGRERAWGVRDCEGHKREAAIAAVPRVRRTRLPRQTASARALPMAVPRSVAAASPPPGAVTRRRAAATAEGAPVDAPQSPAQERLRSRCEAAVVAATSGCVALALSRAPAPASLAPRRLSAEARATCCVFAPLP